MRTEIGLLIIIAAVLASAASAQNGGTEAPFPALSGPYSHGNLTVYFVVSDATEKAGSYLTLQTAIEKRLVTVHETGQVSELSVENSSKYPVYIQAGEIVKGGKQDRVIAVDMVLPAFSGKVPLSSFCVEHGRWQGRGHEAQHVFGSSQAMVATRDLKLAVLHDRDQAKVWENVGAAQKKLANRLDTVVESRQSASSMMLTLENDKVRRVADEYVGALTDAAAGTKGATGAVFIVNGVISSADTYVSPELFTAMWPKLLRAAAVEATAEAADMQETQRPDARDIRAWMLEADKGSFIALENPSGSPVSQRQSKSAVMTESRAQKSGPWVHKNYLRK